MKEWSIQGYGLEITKDFFSKEKLDKNLGAHAERFLEEFPHSFYILDLPHLQAAQDYAGNYYIYFSFTAPWLYPEEEKMFTTRDVRAVFKGLLMYTDVKESDMLVALDYISRAGVIDNV